jgi:hypothetical protein
MIRRLFWVAFGVGLGATTAVAASRWTKKQARKAAPKTIASSMDEGRRAMELRERELRERFGIDETHR